jgi:hypothetical protein
MNRGISIKIFKESGSLKGIVTASISNWTGMAVKIPERLFIKYKKNKELQRPGVYFLLGRYSHSVKQCVYVGEANNLMERITKHLRSLKKDFAIEIIICFYSQDDALTISHTKYLEFKMIDLMSKSGGLRVTNSSRGMRVNIPPSTKAEMDAYLHNMKIILPYLRYSDVIC